MHIEIETEDTFPNQIASRKNGTVYFTLEQPALMFTDQSKYPMQFKLRLAFTQNINERDAVGSIAKGKYILSDSAFRIDRFGQLTLADIDVKTLRPVTQQRTAAAA